METRQDEMGWEGMEWDAWEVQLKIWKCIMVGRRNEKTRQDEIGREGMGWDGMHWRLNCKFGSALQLGKGKKMRGDKMRWDGTG